MTPVLEGPGLAFVGIADDVVGKGFFPAAKLPFQTGRKSGPAAS